MALNKPAAPTETIESFTEPNRDQDGTVAEVDANNSRGNATIYDVAKRADVSISTVSQTLNRPTRVREPTRKRVLLAIQELGYRPKDAAVSQARRGVGRIGVAGPFSCYESYNRRLTGVMLESAGKDRDIVVYDQESAAATISPILRTLPVTGRLDGLLIMGSPVDDELVAELRRRRLPAVLVDSRHDSLSSVNIDDESGAAAVAKHLLDRGHRAFGFVHEHQLSSAYRSAAQARLHGFQTAIAAAGLPLKAVTEVVTDNSISGGRAAVEQLLESGATGVFANHDLLAAGVLQEAHSRGLDVPEQMAIIGFDDGPLAEAIGLTTVRQPFQETGRLGASLLGDEIRNPADIIRRHVLLSADLIRRETT